MGVLVVSVYSYGFYAHFNLRYIVSYIRVVGRLFRYFLGEWFVYGSLYKLFEVLVISSDLVRRFLGGTVLRFGAREAVFVHL